MDRKQFIKSSCAACALGFVGTSVLLQSCSSGPSVNFTLDLTLPANSALNTSGGSLASNGVVVVNLSGSFVAVAQACTHQGCNVSYNQPGNNFTCPCHAGVFDINGNVTSGPPPSALKKYTVTKSGNILTITG